MMGIDERAVVMVVVVVVEREKVRRKM